MTSASDDRVSRRHSWLGLPDGEVDRFALDVNAEYGGHNGPLCTTCGLYFCEHCHRTYWQSECPGVVVPGGWEPGEPITPGDGDDHAALADMIAATKERQ